MFLSCAREKKTRVPTEKDGEVADIRHPRRVQAGRIAASHVDNLYSEYHYGSIPHSGADATALEYLDEDVEEGRPGHPIQCGRRHYRICHYPRGSNYQGKHPPLGCPPPSSPC